MIIEEWVLDQFIKKKQSNFLFIAVGKIRQAMYVVFR